MAAYALACTHTFRRFAVIGGRWQSVGTDPAHRCRASMRRSTRRLSPLLSLLLGNILPRKGDSPNRCCSWRVAPKTNSAGRSSSSGQKIRCFASEFSSGGSAQAIRTSRSSTSLLRLPSDDVDFAPCISARAKAAVRSDSVDACSYGAPILSWHARP